MRDFWRKIIETNCTVLSRTCFITKSYYKEHERNYESYLEVKKNKLLTITLLKKKHFTVKNNFSSSSSSSSSIFQLISQSIRFSYHASSGNQMQFEFTLKHMMMIHRPRR